MCKLLSPPSLPSLPTSPSECKAYFPTGLNLLFSSFFSNNSSVR